MSILEKKLSSFYGSTLTGFQLDVPQQQLVARIKLKGALPDHYNLKVTGISACLCHHGKGVWAGKEPTVAFYYQPSLRKTFETRLQRMLYHQVVLHYNFCIEMQGTEVYIQAKQLSIDHEVWSLY